LGEDWSLIVNTIVPKTVVIASGEALSGVVGLRGAYSPLGRYQLVGLQFPSSWTTADVTFSVSADGSTFVPLYWNGNEYTVGAAASTAVSIEPSALAGWPFVKVRSGTSGTPVNQAAERSIEVLTRVV